MEVYCKTVGIHQAKHRERCKCCTKPKLWNGQIGDMPVVAKEKGFSRTLSKRIVLRLVTTSGPIRNSNISFSLSLINEITASISTILSHQHEAREPFQKGCGIGFSDSYSLCVEKICHIFSRVSRLS